MKDPLGVSPRKGIRESHEVKKNSFDLGGSMIPLNRANAQWLFPGFYIAP